MMTRPPEPRSLLNLWLLMAVSDGCEGIRFRRVRGGYKMWWGVNGAQHEGVPPWPGYVRRFAEILWWFAHSRPRPLDQVRRLVRRLGSATECGTFDLPVGPEFVVAVSYRAAWCWGGVSELEIAVCESAALTVSGIAKLECDRACYNTYSE